MTNDPLKEAIELIRSGRKQEGQKILQLLLRANLQNLPAWFWYVESCSTIEERIQILEACARYNPDNPQVKQALDALLKQQTRVTTTPAPQPGPKPFPETSMPSATSAVPPQKAEIPSAPAVPEKMDARIPITGKASPAPPNTAARLLWLTAGVLIIAFAVLAVYLWTATPRDPGFYRHAQPYEYYLYVPRAYTPGQTWPLFIGIHGSGGSGLDCWNLWQPYAEREGFILLCPTLSDSSGGWYQNDGESKTWAAINQVQNEYQVTPRFFLVGFSAGAQFVQGFSFNYPQSVQAAAVLSAGNYYPPPRQAWGIPFLVVIGDRDDPGAVNGSKQFANALAQNGSNVDYWLLPGVGHAVTNQTKQLTIDFFRQVNGK